MNTKNRIICRIVAYKSLFKVIGEEYAKELFFHVHKIHHGQNFNKEENQNNK
jgi:hypothetical protein